MMPTDRLVLTADNEESVAENDVTLLQLFLVRSNLDKFSSVWLFFYCGWVSNNDHGHGGCGMWVSNDKHGHGGCGCQLINMVGHGGCGCDFAP